MAFTKKVSWYYQLNCWPAGSKVAVIHKPSPCPQDQEQPGVSQEQSIFLFTFQFQLDFTSSALSSMRGSVRRASTTERGISGNQWFHWNRNQSTFIRMVILLFMKNHHHCQRSGAGYIGTLYNGRIAWWWNYSNPHAIRLHRQNYKRSYYSTLYSFYKNQDFGWWWHCQLQQEWEIWVTE